MKTLILVISLLFTLATYAFAQGDIASTKFHQGSNLFINGNPEAALAAVNEGLKAEPQNTKLNTLKKLLEQEKKKQEQQKKEQQEREKKEKEKQKQQQQQNKDQQNKENKEDKEKENKENKENKEQQNKDQQKKEQEEKQNKEQQDKKDQEEKEPKDKEQQQKENRNKDKENKEVPPEVVEKLKDMKISEDKARMILEAMKNQEIQYLQQNKRKATKSKDKGKPDW